MNLLMSNHALEQARERGISINEIKETIKNSAKFSQEDKTIAIYRHIKIIFKKIKETVFIITVMIKKTRRWKIN